jgi:predicted transcriptional regulator
MENMAIRQVNTILKEAKYAGRISAVNFEGANAKYKLIFEMHYKDFTYRLQAELELLLKDSPDTLKKVVQNAVFRIFRARHKRIFFECIQNDDLKWRFLGLTIDSDHKLDDGDDPRTIPATIPRQVG